jgi:hypothetical protein
MPDIEGVRADLCAHPPAGQARGDRVAVTAHADHRLGVHARRDLQGGAVRLSWQIPEQPPLTLKRLPDRLSSPDDRAIQIRPARLLQVLVELSDAGHLRHRHQMPAAKTPDLSLHAALLVSPALARQAEHGLEQVVRAQRNEPVALHATAPLQDLRDRAAQALQGQLESA